METPIKLIHKPHDQGETQTDIYSNPIGLNVVEGVIEAMEQRQNKWLRATCRDFMGRPIDIPAVIRQKHTRLADGRLWCSRCQDHLAPSEFSKAKNPRGRRYWCKSCCADYERVTYHTGKIDRVMNKLMKAA